MTDRRSHPGDVLAPQPAPSNYPPGTSYHPPPRGAISPQMLLAVLTTVGGLGVGGAGTHYYSEARQPPPPVNACETSLQALSADLHSRLDQSGQRETQAAQSLLRLAEDVRRLVTEAEKREAVARDRASRRR